MRRLLETRCTALGVVVQTFQSGSEVLESLASAQSIGLLLPDFMLIDNDLPGFDGLDVIRMARRIGYTGVMFICTGTLTRELVERVRMSGGQGVIEKGSDKRTLECVMSAIRRLRPLRTESSRAGEAA
jgi:CheY-like chemotaxis protein